MMRNILMMLIAIALVASYGCGKGDTKRVAKGPRGGDGSTRTKAPSPAMPGVDTSKKSDDKKEDAEDDKKAGLSAAEKRAAAKSGKIKYRRGKRIAPQPSAGGGPGPGDDESEVLPEEKTEDEKDEDVADEVEPDDEPEEEKFVSFMDRARKAFSNGHDPEGFQYLYAYALTDDDALANYPISWYEGISEPRLGIRWGVAIDYNPGAFDGDPPVIGDPVDSGPSRNDSGGGGGDFGTAGGSATPGAGARGLGAPRTSGRGRGRGSSTASNQGQASRDRDVKPPAEELKYYTGDFGTKLVDRYQKRRLHDKAYYGPLLRDIEKFSGNDEEEEVAERDDSNRRSSTDNDFEILGTGSTIAGPGTRGNRRDNDDDDEVYEAEKTTLAPGMMILGLGKQADMLARAKSLGLDVLVMYIVKVKHTERRNNETSTKSNTQVKVISVKTGEELVATKSLSNVAVANARDNNRDDPVEVELDKVFSGMADDQFRAIDLPDYDADDYRKRFEFLLKSEYDNPLPILVEIKSYLEAGYIDNNDYVAAVEQFLGKVEAQDLIDGDMKKRELALRRYLPGEYDFGADSDESDFR